MPYKDHIKDCPCCKGYYPFPVDNGWVNSVCKECETSLSIDPKYPYLGISIDSENPDGVAIHMPNSFFPMWIELPKSELTDSPEPSISM